MATTPRIRYDIEAAVSGASDVAALAGQLEGLAGTLEGDLKTQALASAAALRELGAKQGAIENFRTLKTETASTAERLKEAQAAAQKLGAELSNSTGPTRAQAGQMQKLRDNVRAAKDELLLQTRALDNSRAVLRSYGVGTENLVSSERAVRQAIAETTAEVRKLPAAMEAAAAATRAQARAQAQAASAAKISAKEQVAASKEIERQEKKRAAEAKAGLQGIGTSLRNIQNIAAVAIGGTFLTSIARDVAEVADEYQNLGARIKLVTGEGAAFDAAFAGVKEIALATNSELDGTATLFARIAQAGAEIGVSNEKALALTQTINQAIQLSGGSAEGAKAAIVQLVQGLQSGVLRGEEFNSVMEQSPRLARALADGLGVGIGELRKLAQQGKLTSETVIRSLQGQTDAVAAEFAKLPPTVGRAIQNLATNWTVYVGEVDKATGASQAAANAINAVAENLDEIAGVATRAGAVILAALAVQAAGAVRAYIVEVVAARSATSLLALEMSKLPKTLQITVALAGFEAAYQFGDYLRENSQTARELGIEFVNFVEKQVNSLQFLKEAGAAIFTNDTIGAALDRYNERADQQRQIIAQMYEDAAKAPSEIEAAANKAAAATASIGEAAAKNINLFEQEAKAYAESVAQQVQANEVLQAARNTDAQIALSGLQVQKELSKQAEDLARFIDDEVGVRKARIEQVQIEIQITEAKVDVARAEAEGTIAVAQAKLAELQATGELTDLKEIELQNSIRLAQAKLAEAQALGQSSELLKRQLELLQKVGTATENAGRSAERAGKGIRRFGQDLRETSTEIEQHITWLDRLNQRNQGVGKLPPGGRLARNGETLAEGVTEVGSGGQYRNRDGFASDAKGSAIAAGGELTTLTGIAAFLKQAGLDEAQAKRLALEFSDGNGNIPYLSNPGQIKYGGRESTISEALLKAAEKITFGVGQGGAAAVGRTVNVNLTVGGKTKTVPTTEEGASNLVGALQAASISAGR